MRVAICALLLAVTPLPFAATAVSAGPSTASAAGVPLKPGYWQWSDTGGNEPLLVVVNLATQRAAVFRGEERVGLSVISSGKDGKETPTGVFPILEKREKHVSNLYHVPMPYMQRLTWDGIALHAGRAIGKPLSRGCIRFPAGFARALFQVTRRGTTVVVVDEPAFDGADVATESPQVAMQVAGSEEFADRPQAPAEPLREVEGVVLASTGQR